MKKIKDKWFNSRTRYTKVEFNNKSFRRFHYYYNGRTVDVLWLSDDRSLLPEKIEKKLEKEFEKVG